MKLYTRRDIIKIWTEQEKHLDDYTCPNCRDILESDNTHYWCKNNWCKNNWRVKSYTKIDDQIIMRLINV